MNITTLTALRSLYLPARERSVKKQLNHIDAHCAKFIALAPLVVVSSSGSNGTLDASPRGGTPGFVQVQGTNTLLIPDAPGNNRLDTLENIVQTGQVGFLFLVPGVDETLRVNGTAVLSTAEADLQACADAKRTPKLVIRVTVQAAYLHCAKALLRSKLWSGDYAQPKGTFPSIARMVGDQVGMVEVQTTDADNVAGRRSLRSLLRSQRRRNAKCEGQRKPPSSLPRPAPPPGTEIGRAHV